MVLYSVYAGISTKVGPGVVRLTPDQVTADQNFAITIEGYNTEFDQISSSNSEEAVPNVWIRVHNKLKKSSSVEVVDRNHIVAHFEPIPLRQDSSRTVSSTVVIEDNYHGMFLGSQMLKVTFPQDTIAQNDSLTDSAIRPNKSSQVFFSFPYRYILYETIRNLNFHVPMWFVMMTLLLISFIFSIRHLQTKSMVHDVWANGFAKAGLLFGLMGISTGMFWATFTWGTPWTSDPKLNGAAVAVLMYIAYQILRSSIDDADKSARISAVYNIFAYPIFIVLIIVLPKMAEFSLHPGSGDSVGFNTYDLDNNLRRVFYPAVLGWILVGSWIGQITSRIDKIKLDKEWNS